MHVVAFLVVVLLVAFLAGVHKSQYARMAIGSIFGLAFLVIWPFVIYAGRLLMWPELYIDISFTLLCTISVVCVFVLRRVKCIEVIAVITFSIFVVSVISSWVLENKVKHLIDEFCYLTAALEEVKTEKLYPQAVYTFSHLSSGYSINIPVAWIRKDDMGKQFIYFQRIEGGSVAVELRPMCMDKRETSLGQVVMNVRDVAQDGGVMPEVECRKFPGGRENCSVQYKDREGKLVKLSEFGISKDMRKGYYLDFIIHKQDKSTARQIEEIIASIRPSVRQDNLQQCLGLQAWF